MEVNHLAHLMRTFNVQLKCTKLLVTLSSHGQLLKVVDVDMEEKPLSKMILNSTMENLPLKLISRTG